MAVPAGVADLNRQASAAGAYEVDICGDAKRPSSAARGRGNRDEELGAMRHRRGDAQLGV